MPRPALRDEERDREQEPAVETAALFEALTAGLPVDDAELDDEQRARRLLAHLLRAGGRPAAARPTPEPG